MNDFVFRGFCQKCESPIIMNEKGEPSHYDVFMEKHGMSLMMAHTIEPVWFLSPNQMKIILFSEEFNKIYLDSNYKSYLPFLIHSLDTNPFLVAKILKENEVE